MAKPSRGDEVRALVKKLRNWLPAKQAEFRAKILAVGQDAVPALNWALTSLDDGLHQPACELLGQIGDTRAVGPLLGFFARTKSAMYKSAAAQALGRIGSKEAYGPILKILKEDDICTRDEMAEALGLLGDRRALPHLIKMLDHEDDYARAAASRGLGSLGDVKAVMPLLSSRSRPWTRKQKRAERALVAIGKDTLPHLRKALTHEDWYVREGAVRALGCFGDVVDVEALIARLEDDRVEVCFAAAQALGGLADSRAAEPLLRLRTRSKNHRRLRIIADALEAVGWTAPHPAAPARLDWLVGKGNWEELERIGALAVPALLCATRDEDCFLQMDAVSTLGRIGEVAAIPRLLQCLGDKTPGVRADSAVALCRIDGKGHFSSIVALLDEKERSIVRRKVAEALGRLQDRRAIPHLLPLIEPITKIRETIARTLELRLVAAEALRALKYRPRSVRGRVLLLVAAGAWDELLAMGSEAVPSLLKSLAAEREATQHEMVRVLGRIGELSAAAGVLEWLFARPAFIREAAVRKAWRDCLAPLFGDFGDLILRVASTVTCKKIDHSRGNTDDFEFKYDLRVSYVGLRRLCATAGDVAVYLLHLVSGKKDGEVVVRDYEGEIWGAETKGPLSFKGQRKRAAKELAWRGHPKARAAALRKRRAWRYPAK